MAAPSDMLFGAHYDDVSGQSFDPDYVRDGSGPTTADTGTPTIVSSGKFNGGLELNATEYVEYTGSVFMTGLVQTGAISFWIKPGYTGNPTTQQYFVFVTKSGGFQNRVSIWHTSSGLIQAYVNSSAGTLISSVSTSWSPTADTWYHVELNYDVNAGSPATRLFIDGSQIGSTSTASGTRTGTCDYMNVGAIEGTSGPQDHTIDEVVVYDAVQHTTTFTPPTTAPDMDPKGLDNGSFETADGDSVALPSGWDLYLASTSFDFANFGPPYAFVESHEYDYDDNQDALAELGDSDVELAVFNLLNREEYDGGWDNDNPIDDWPDTAQFAEFDTGTPEEVEDYEEEWDSNEDALAQFDPGDISLALFDSGTPEDREDYEEEWGDNENALSSLGPGDVDLADFETASGTDTVEDYDSSKISLDIPTSGLPKGGAAQTLSPTIGARIEFTSSAFTGEVKIQTQSKGSSTWVDRDSVTTPSSIVDLTEGYWAVRAYTVSLSSGTPVATRHWPVME